MIPTTDDLRDAVKERLLGTGTAQHKGLTGLDGEVLAIHALDAAVAAGWSVVFTDPVTEPDERPIILEEWGA